jgi:hypothetical protein
LVETCSLHHPNVILDDRVSCVIDSTLASMTKTTESMLANSQSNGTEVIEIISLTCATGSIVARQLRQSSIELS